MSYLALSAHIDTVAMPAVTAITSLTQQREASHTLKSGRSPLQCCSREEQYGGRGKLCTLFWDERVVAMRCGHAVISLLHLLQKAACAVHHWTFARVCSALADTRETRGPGRIGERHVYHSDHRQCLN